MSRSYKHTPRCGDRKGKYAKRLANRTVRIHGGESAFPPYGGYRKVYERWNICDYEQVWVTFARFRASEKEWSARTGRPVPDLAESRNQYERWFIRK